MAKHVEAVTSTDEMILAVLHDMSNSVTSLSGGARTLVESADRLDAPVRDELGALVVRQVIHVEWLVDAMRQICGSPGRDPLVLDTAFLVRAAADLVRAPVRIEGSSAFSGDFRRIRLGLEALFDALARRDAVVSLDETGRTVIVRAGYVDLGFGGVRWRLALARRLLGDEGLTLEIGSDGDETRATVVFPAPRSITI